MGECRLDLLHEPLLRLRLRGGGARDASLPEVLAELSRGDEVVDFSRVRPHQQHAWHAFLVQLAALAVHRRGGLGPGPTDEALWREALLGLTGGRDEPFRLVVDDLAQPAFMQPPVPEGTVGGWTSVATPDELDVLITGRNHDLKINRATRAAPELWVHALITLQTTQGYSGRSNYGIARMNSGLGSRPCVTRLPGWGPGARFRRDLRVVLDTREAVASDHGFRAEGGVALLWLEPWDGTTSIELWACDPYVIEVCRRVRLRLDGGRLVANTSPSKVARAAARERAGVVGDPWTPTRRETPVSALTVPASGFDYRRTAELLLGDEYVPSAAQEPVPEEEGGGEPLFFASVLVRGQGKTEGFHLRVVELPRAVRAALGPGAARERLAQRARERVDDAATVRKSVLRPALQALFQSGPERLDFADDRPRAWLDRYSDAVDGVFFDRLWHDVWEGEDEARRRWRLEAVEIARGVLARAMERVPLPSARRYRARAIAERVFNGTARKAFPDLFAPLVPTGADRHDRPEHA